VAIPHNGVPFADIVTSHRQGNICFAVLVIPHNVVPFADIVRSQRGICVLLFWCTSHFCENEIDMPVYNMYHVL
jgi:hypothetical protein